MVLQEVSKIWRTTSMQCLEKMTKKRLIIQLFTNILDTVLLKLLLLLLNYHHDILS